MKAAAAETDGATNDPPQHVAAALIGRNHAIADQERFRAGVIAEPRTAVSTSSSIFPR